MKQDGGGGVSEALYRALLGLYPPRFRRRHGEDMAELFVDLCRQEQEKRGRRGVVAVTLRTLAQLPASLLGEWWAAARGSRRALPPPSRPPRRQAIERRPLSRLGDNVRFALRSLRKSPVFAAVSILTLGLGVGANTAIWSVVYGVLLRPLALTDPGSLVMLRTSEEKGGAFPGISPAQLDDWREHLSSFDGIAAWVWDNVTLRDGGETEALDNVLAVSGNFFSVLGVEAIRGRALLPADEEPNRRGSVVVISEEEWRRRWGGNPAILGRTILLDEHPLVVVGIMPAGIPLPGGVRMWFPQDFDPADESLRGRLMTAGRLRPGSSRADAAAELDRLLPSLEQRHREPHIAHVTVLPVLDAIAGDVRPTLLLLGAAVGLVLLITCANLANLLLARASVREREMATRRALGAGPAQILGLVLTESLVLAVLGGVAGLGLAAAGHRLVTAVAPGILPRLDAVRLDLPVLLFAFVLALFAGALFGLAPALHALRVDTGRALHGAGRGVVGGRGLSRARAGLLVAQIAVAAALLVAAGLLLRSLLALRAVDPGFSARGVVAARIDLDEHAFTDPQEAIYFESLVDRLRGVPGITRVGASSGLPIDPITLDFEIGWERPDSPTPEGETPPTADFRVAVPGTFATLGIPLLEGRDFTDLDVRGSQPVVIVNRTLARKVWSGESPLEREIVLRFGPGRYRLQVVGVVGDVRSRGLRSEPRPEVFLAHQQAPFSSMNVVVSGTLPQGALMEALRREALELDPSQPPSRIFPVETLVADSLARDRFSVTVLGLFAVLAALLASSGIYGVIAYWVSRSRREIGLHLALGAGGRQVMAMVVRRGLAVTALGLVIGIAGALAGGRLLASMMFGVGIADPVVLGAVALLLGSVAVTASFVPARQASRLDPVTTLKED